MRTTFTLPLDPGEPDLPDGAHVTVKAGAIATFTDRGIAAGVILEATRGDDGRSIVYTIDLNSEAAQLLLVSPYERVTVPADIIDLSNEAFVGGPDAIPAPPNPVAVVDEADDDFLVIEPMRPGLADADYHDRGQPCDNEHCEVCYEHSLPRPEPDPDAYVTALEDALERRETGARVLDLILEKLEANIVDADGLGLLELYAGPNGRITLELLSTEVNFVRARQRAGFKPDPS